MVRALPNATHASDRTNDSFDLSRWSWKIEQLKVRKAKKQYFGRSLSELAQLSAKISKIKIITYNYIYFDYDLFMA